MNGGIGQKYVRKQRRKRKVPKWLDYYVWDRDVLVKGGDISVYIYMYLSVRVLNNVAWIY